MENDLLNVDKWVAQEIARVAQLAYGDVENARRAIETVHFGGWEGLAAEGAWEMLHRCYRESIALSESVSQALHYSQEGAQL